ncbi:tetratricopeptide repeat protein [Thermodesulfobacteriota bacterium]
MIDAVRYLSWKKIIDNGWQYLIIIVSVVIAYIPTFTGGFILDDNRLIKDNPYVRELHSISSYLSQEDGITDEKDLGVYHTGYYRPLINLTYWLDYKLWGMNAPGFRLTNLLLHLLTCFVLLQLIALLINNRQTAFWVTCLFALHPVNTESVSWVISRNNILVTFFILSSFYLYIIWWEKGNYINGIISVIFLFCALLSKEFALMIFPVFFMYHRFLSEKKRSVFTEIISYMPYIVFLGIYFLLRKKVVGAFLTPFDAAQLWTSIYFIPYLIIWNLKLVFIPSGLHYFYLSYPSSFYQWGAILPFGLFLLIIAALWLKRSNRILLFSGLSFFAFILPVLNIIPSASTIVTLAAMRWLYLPMAFICLGVAWIIEKVLSRFRVSASSLLIILILYFGLYTYVLNINLWHDEETFYRHEVLGFKNYFLAGDMAERYFKNGNHREAEKYFKIAIKKYPNRAYYYINYSALLIETGRPDAAVSRLKEAKSLIMTHHERGEWSNNMGMALLRLGENDMGLEFLKKSIVFASDEPIFWANLGGAYGMMRDYENSVIALKKGLNISPDLITLRTNLAVTYINMKDYAKAISTLEAIHETTREADKNVSRLLKLAREKMLKE